MHSDHRHVSSWHFWDINGYVQSDHIVLGSNSFSSFDLDVDSEYDYEKYVVLFQFNLRTKIICEQMKWCKMVEIYGIYFFDS